MNKIKAFFSNLGTKIKSILPTSEKTLTTLRIIAYIIGLGLVIIPLIIGITYLKSKHKTITLHPTFKIIDVVNDDNIDISVLDEAVKIAEQGLAKAHKSL